MIKKLFLPERIGNKRTYSQRILGLSLQDENLSSVQVYAKRSKNIVEKSIEQKLEEGSLETYPERATQAIKQIIQKFDKYDQIRICIPASLVIFKELEMPFKDPSKIRMILDYEIESMLPFSIEESITDFIITKQTKKDKTSQVLVAAIRKQDLASILDIYTAAGLNPNNITIDLFAIYSLYQQIPEYQNIQNASAIVDLGHHATRVTLLQNGQLRLTRMISRGIMSVAKSISDDINMPIEDVEKKLEKYGFQKTRNENFDKALQNHMINFFNDIQFTLNSFSLKLNFYKGISKILFTGNQSNLKDLARFANKLLQISCEIFDSEKLFTSKIFKSKIKRQQLNWITLATSLGTALPSPQQYNFDLRRKAFILQDTKLINKQLLAALIIIFAIFGKLSFSGYFQSKDLSGHIEKIEKREITKLKEIFPRDFKLAKQITFRNLLGKAETLVNEKLELWAPFEKRRMRPLEIMQELTNIIDKRRFDVNINQVSITEEDGSPKIEVDGFFRSKTGSDHFRYFDELEKRFYNSKVLALWDEKEEIDSRMVEDKGIRFTVKLKPKE